MSEKPGRPWYRIPMFWLIMAIPLLSLVMAVVMIVLASRTHTPPLKNNQQLRPQIIRAAK